jgi:hypothetical protein
MLIFTGTISWIEAKAARSKPSLRYMICGGEIIVLEIGLSELVKMAYFRALHG